MADDAFYMKKALEEARRAYEEDEIPVGAVVVCGDRILARAHNLTETLTDVTAHAEMQVLPWLPATSLSALPSLDLLRSAVPGALLPALSFRVHDRKAV